MDHLFIYLDQVEVGPLVVAVVEALEVAAQRNLANLRPVMIEIVSVLAMDSSDTADLAERSKR